MPSLSSLFARRYLFSKKSHSVINLISVVSGIAVGLPVAAMVILLSVFNGFEMLVKGLYDDFDADFLITPARGKFFHVDSVTLDRINAVKGVHAATTIYEENVLAEYNNREVIATVRGVDSLYNSVIPIEKLISGGDYRLYLGDHPQAIVGRGIASMLAINPYSADKMQFFTPTRSANFSSLLPLGAFAVDSLMIGGVYTLDAQTDSKYIFVPIAFAQNYFDSAQQISAIMVAAEPNSKKAIESIMGDEFVVKSRFEQKATMYNMMKYEKWALALVTMFVMIIASFAVIGSLSMLIIEKRDDIFTLEAMGSPKGLIRKIFVSEGFLIALIGGIFGIILGLAISLAQQHFGFIKLPSQSMLVDSYPVVVKATDIAIIAASFMVINYIIAKFTVAKMVK